MTTHNTGSDVANTAVRAFLIETGKYYLGEQFDIGNGKGKKEWERIRDIIFKKKCAYCSKGDVKLQMEHLVMFNREQFGLHHPGNVVPACKECNTRKKIDGKYPTWEDHLKLICDRLKQKNEFQGRRNKILGHIRDQKYPVFSQEESHAIQVVVQRLYDQIKKEVSDSFELYKDLDKAFVKK